MPDDARLQLFISLVSDLSGGRLTEEELTLLRQHFQQLDQAGQDALGNLGRAGRSGAMAFHDAGAAAAGLASVLSTGPLGPQALIGIERGLAQIGMAAGAAMSTAATTGLALGSRRSRRRTPIPRASHRRRAETTGRLHKIHPRRAGRGAGTGRNHRDGQPAITQPAQEGHRRADKGHR